MKGTIRGSHSVKTWQQMGRHTHHDSNSFFEFVFRLFLIPQLNICQADFRSHAITQKEIFLAKIYISDVIKSGSSTEGTVNQLLQVA